jgi:predicted nucleotidyltransferase component of viral defense system
MDANNSYFRQLQFLIQLLPFVGVESCFALKGGTAINLFVLDLPRLSVDIDLVYLRKHERALALTEIKFALQRIAKRIQLAFPAAHITQTFLDKADALRLVVAHKGVKIKIELSPVLRGTVYEPEVRAVTTSVEAQFGFAEIAVVSLADLYAGKICAALDRQHPRDLFDVKLLLENQGLTPEIRKAFIVYLISHPRPIAELLNPTPKNLQGVYSGEFITMTQQSVSLQALTDTRTTLIALLNESMNRDEKQFLLSFKRKQPDWSLLGLADVENLPAIHWKLQNPSASKTYSGDDSPNQLISREWIEEPERHGGHYQAAAINLIGGGGNDELLGQRYGESLQGGDGNDILNGNGGKDFLDGGIGNDLLTGATEGSTWHGGQGRDMLIASYDFTVERTYIASESDNTTSRDFFWQDIASFVEFDYRLPEPVNGLYSFSAWAGIAPRTETGGDDTDQVLFCDAKNDAHYSRAA